MPNQKIASGVILLVFLIVSGWSLSPDAVAIVKGAQMKTQKITNNFYVIIGGNGLGANTGVLVEDEGITLIDSANIHEESHQQLMKAIRAISDKPVKYVINTHHHRDHSGGNEFFAKQGATVIAQENALIVRQADFVHLTFKNRLTLRFGAETIEAFHVNAHTMDDAIIYLKKANVVFTGDTHATTWGPSVSNGGIQGIKSVLNFAIDLSDEKTKVVPGHGEVVNKQHVIKYLQDTLEWSDYVINQQKQGITTESLVKDKKVHALFERFNGNNKEQFMTADMMSRRIDWHIRSSSFSESEISLPAFEIEKFVGFYHLPGGKVAEIYAEEGRLFLRFKGEHVTELLPRKGGKFEFRNWNNGEYLTFEFDASSEKYQLRIYEEEKPVIATRTSLTAR
ncbi:MBL fold metallo-hydrolase [Aliikangiella sp. G2MR2-5]|uniref:MBL fold metallo-hydrolase n=1 Tax=Aliikangiella sp. G2MR2-5 TaxID=2788943 RepID=UPI0018AB8FA7|nr:MBL fold metallo-hydrolase [Aliikangiella sp. G2MR2-5]